MSTLKYNTWLNTDNTENYKCRAWVNFNGQGTVAIRASGNVSSITDRGTGAYTVNFTTAMPDANYAFTSGVWSGISTNPTGVAAQAGQAYSTTALGILTTEGTNIANDYLIVNIAVFR